MHRLLIITICLLVLARVPVPAHAQSPTPDVVLSPDPARIVAALMSLHPDVVAECDALRVEADLRAARELEIFSSRSGLPRHDIACAWDSFNFQLGEEFRLAHNSPPDDEWWNTSHRERLAMFGMHFGGWP